MGCAEYDLAADLPGVKKDVDRMEHLFSNVYNYDNVYKVKEGQQVNRYYLSGRKIEERLIRARSIIVEYKVDHDAIILYFAGHGSETAIYGSDGDQIRISTLEQYFSNARLPGLAGKPKIIILDTCRGIQDAQSMDESSRPSIFGYGIKKIRNRTDDIIVMNGSVKGYRVWENTENGGYFTQAFCQILSADRGRSTLSEMTAMINKRCSEISRRKQTSVFANRLHYSVKFVPQPRDYNNHNV